MPILNMRRKRICFAQHERVATRDSSSSPINRLKLRRRKPEKENAPRGALKETRGVKTRFSGSPNPVTVTRGLAAYPVVEQQVVGPRNGV